MVNKRNLILTIDTTQIYSTEILKQKLDMCLNWLRIVPGVYLLTSNTEINVLYERFKKALPNNRFFISNIDISTGNYQGWLPEEKWIWIRKNKTI